MSRYAHLDSQTNTVINIIVGGGEFAIDDPVHWKRCSFSPEEKKRDAIIGDTYNPDLDIFTPPKPYPSWVLSDDQFSWVPPIAFPEEAGTYEWDEETISWKTIPDTE
jgi:hypothetical protein